MDIRARLEYGVVLIVGLVFALLLIPAGLDARQERRDGIRRDEVAAFKQLIEQYYNEHDTYPLTFAAAPHEYRIVARDASGARSWYLRAVLENAADEAEGYDAEEGRNFYWRVVREGDRFGYEVCGGTPGCGLRDER